MELNQTIEEFKKLTPTQREEFIGNNYQELALLLYRNSAAHFLDELQTEDIIKKLLSEFSIEFTELLDEFCSDKVDELINDDYINSMFEEDY